MRILLLGGTGAMGAPLADILGKNKDHDVFITSRKFRISNYSNVQYIKGNAHDLSFLSKVMEKEFDVIVDFMKYSDQEFRKRFNIFLKYSKQYIFISSCRVFSGDTKITNEDSYRLLDTSKDKDFLSTDEYSLSKARQENILRESIYKNWTIVRPYITYSSSRLQLGIYEKEDWLYRVINRLPIVFGKDMASSVTTLTSGYDVSNSIFELMGNVKALGEEFNIVNSESVTWNDVINIYSDELKDILGYGIQVYWIDNSESIAKVMHAEYQNKYDRLFDRNFSNEKLMSYLGSKTGYIPISIGLKKCLKEFVSNDELKFENIPWKLNAYMDKITGEKMPLNAFSSNKLRLKYLICRYTPYFKFILSK